MKCAIVLGTRPEIIKLGPIIKKLKKSERIIIYSGQHYDYELGLRFFEELRLPMPDYTLKIQNKSPAKQIGKIISSVHDILLETKPDTVMVHGDTNTALAGAISGLKTGIPINHVESGLRSYDWRMPEEHNRISIDHISEFLFTPTKYTKKILMDEKVHGKIFVTGNTVIDAILENEKIAEKNSTLKIDDEEFILCTLHRAENVDNRKILNNVINALIESDKKVIFPIHPRTLKRLHEFNLFNKLKSTKKIKMTKILGYFDLLQLMKKCIFIISDSGGIQEEASSFSIRKKVLVIRKTTDRPEAVESGFSEIVGTEKNKIKLAIKNTYSNPSVPKKISPYGNGNTSELIISILRKYI